MYLLVGAARKALKLAWEEITICLVVVNAAMAAVLAAEDPESDKEDGDAFVDDHGTEDGESPGEALGTEDGEALDQSVEICPAFDVDHGVFEVEDPDDELMYEEEMYVDDESGQQVKNELDHDNGDGARGCQQVNHELDHDNGDGARGCKRRRGWQ
jgi:hypothetical protein